MRQTALIVTGAAALLLGTQAMAETVVESWSCKANDEKTLEDVQAANMKWLEFVNSRVDGEVSSSLVVPIVGDWGEFLFVDSFRDLAHWSAVKAELDTDEGSAIEQALQEVFTCSGNRLWRDMPTK